MKRIFDIIFSVSGIIILFPVLTLIFIYVKSDSKGPAIFRQKRVGLNGRDFWLLKFRSMYCESDKKGLITIGNRDPRITRSGYFLRKYKLDELPQLFNVLKGDMSLVGPRPEVRKYVDLYSENQKQILAIRPGITDFASIEYSNENELLAKSKDPEITYVEEIMPAKILLALKYKKEMSLGTDLKILFGTLRKIIRH